MTKIKSIISKLETLYPEKKAEKWDKIGLQYGDERQKVQKIYICLDLTTESFSNAVNYNADMIITHHPFLWEDTLEEEFEKAPYKKILNSRLTNTNIALYALHTNFDQTNEGTSYQIAKKIGYKKIGKSKNSRFAAVIKDSVNIKSLKEKFKRTFNMTTFITNNETNDVFESFAILAGSGSIGEMVKLKEEGIKLFITSDVKWSDWITAKEEGITILEITHGIETVFVDAVSDFLKQSYKSLDIKIEHSYEIGKL